MKSTVYKPRIALLAGEKGVGKTTWVLGLPDELKKFSKKAFGIATPKAVTDGNITGIWAVDLAAGQKKMLAEKDDLPGNRIGQWRFLHEGIEFFEETCDPKKQSGIAIIDEIGPMELEGRGLVKTVDNLVNGRYVCALVVVRKELMGIWAARLSNAANVEIFGFPDEKQEVIKFLINEH